MGDIVNHFTGSGNMVGTMSDYEGRRVGGVIAINLMKRQALADRGICPDCPGGVYITHCGCN